MKKEHLALVTGGTRGIGKAISLALKNAGYDIVANYSGNEEAAKEFKKDTNIPIYKWDVSKFDESAKWIRKIEEDQSKSIDIVINNAGITRDKFLHKHTYEEWIKVIDINLASCFNICHHVINNMREKNFGRIVNISSVNALSGQIGQTNYAASKAGIIGFSKALALENAKKGITVNVVAPGYIETDMTANIDEKILENIISQIPVGRIGKPDEVARAILFLINEHSGFITGETLSINGGQYMN